MSILVAESRFASQQSQPGEWGRGNRISSFPSSASKILAQQSLLIGLKASRGDVRLQLGVNTYLFLVA